MKSKQDPESISVGPHSLETEKIYKVMYPDITPMYTNKSKFTSHLHNKIYNTFTKQNLQHIYTTKFIKFTLKII